MSLIKCTPGGSADNCYTTLAGADAYYALGLRMQQWLTYPDETRERALIQATGELERLGGPASTWSPARPHFGGAPYDEMTPQALHFPRIGDLTRTGTKVVPTAICNAVAEQALWLLDRQANAPLIDREELRADGVQQVSVDGLSETYGASDVPQGIGPKAWVLFQPFVSRGAPTRAGAGRPSHPRYRAVPD